MRRSPAIKELVKLFQCDAINVWCDGVFDLGMFRRIDRATSERRDDDEEEGGAREVSKVVGDARLAKLAANKTLPPRAPRAPKVGEQKYVSTL